MLATDYSDKTDHRADYKADKENTVAHHHALIIEDNSVNVQVLGKLLTLQGVTHTTILHPDRLAAALENTADVVFLDLEMPGLNGYDVLALLKADDRFRSVPIVACTVHVSEMNTAYQLGFDSFIPKPLDSDRFPGQLARILHGEHVWERV